MSTPNSVADRLAIARRLRALTQEQLSERAQVPQAQVSRIERGAVADPGFSTVVKLAAALSVSLEALAAPNVEHLMQELAAPAADGVLFGVSALSSSPVSLRRSDPGRHSPHLLICGQTDAGRVFAAKLELLRQMQLGVRATAIDTRGEFAGLFEPHLRRAVDLPWPEGRSVPLLIPPIGSTVSEQALLISPWLASVIGEDPRDPFVQELLGRALGSVYGRFGYGPKSEIGQGAAPTLEYLTGELRAGKGWGAGPLTAKAAELADKLDRLLGEAGAHPHATGGRHHEERHVCWDLTSVIDPRLQAHLAVLALMDAVPRAPEANGQLRIVLLEATASMLETPVLCSMLESVAANGRTHGLALTLLLDGSNPELIAGSRKLIAESGTILLLRSTPEAGAALSLALSLSDSELQRVLDARTGEGLLLLDSERGMVSIVEGATADERERIAARRPPLPDIKVDLTEFGFQGYGPEASRAWAIHDQHGRLLLVDNPANPSTSVNSAPESALCTFLTLYKDDRLREAWVYDGRDEVWALDPESGEPAERAGGDPRETEFVRVALEELRRRNWRPCQG